MWARKESTLETFDRVIMARFLGTGGRGWDGWVVGRKGEVFFRPPGSLHTQYQTKSEIHLKVKTPLALYKFSRDTQFLAFLNETDVHG